MVQSVAAVSASQATAAIGAAGRVSMSQIQGVRKPLLHANSFTGERLPKYGIETSHEEELGKVLTSLILNRFEASVRVIKKYRRPLTSPV